MLICMCFWHQKKQEITAWKSQIKMFVSSESKTKTAAWVCNTKQTKEAVFTRYLICNRLFVVMSEHDVVVMTEHDIVARIWVTNDLMKIFVTVISISVLTDVLMKNWVTEILMWILIEISIEISVKNLIEISAKNSIEISAKNLIERRLYSWKMSLIIVFTSVHVRKFIAWEVNGYEMLSFVWEITSKWKLNVETWST